MPVIKHRSVAGDTIIEVLIAIAVSATVIALIYVTMNKNSAITRSNQERIEATRMVQSQIEYLRVGHGNLAQTLTTPTAPFCYRLGSVMELSLGAVSDDLADDDFSLYGDIFTGCSDNGYVVGVKRSTTDARQYTIYVRWDRTGGTAENINDNRDEIKMTYRVGL